MTLRLWTLPLLASALGCGSSSSETGHVRDAGSDTARELVDAGDDVASRRSVDGARDAAQPHPIDAATVPMDGGGEGGIVLPNGRTFPDTNATIGLLVDQLPSMNPAQMQFATSHFVGTEKQLLSVTQQLRALNPAFIVLHYHLAMWQSTADFIVDGTSWGNDLAAVTMNESWFWHNTSAGRVTAPDGKFLMDVTVPGFQQYWQQSLETQVADGDYDAIMFDSASPNLLQGWCGGSGASQDPRLAGTAASTTLFPELGNATWIDAWQSWITPLNASLAAKGIPLIPNTGPFITEWDTTDYTLTAGIFSEGFAGTDFAVSDWQHSTGELLKLASLDRIMILQNYLTASTDVATRMYYLGNYLLVKGHYTYLDYFASGPLEWYPEWAIDLGLPTTPVTTDVTTLASGGVYRRDFVKGSVLVNPTSSAVVVPLGAIYQQVMPSGGGAVDTTGTAPGSLTMQPVTSVSVGPTAAVVVLK